jgi:hypothetical protein
VVEIELDGPRQLRVADRLIFYCCVKEAGADGVIVVIASPTDLLAVEVDGCCRDTRNTAIISTHSGLS